MSNTNNTMQTQTSNAFHNVIMEAGGKDRPPMLAPEGSSKTTTNRYMENYTNVSEDIRNQLNAEAEVVRIILTEPDMVAEDNALSKEKDIDKLMALISLSYKKIYKPTNNNLRTSLNTNRANQDNNLRTRYDNQRAVNVDGARENVARECQKPKRAKDLAYHKEKMLLCKQEEAGIQLSAEQVDWRDDTDDEPEDQELEVHYLYMAKIQEVTSDAADNSGPILDQPESVNDTYLGEQGDTNITTDSLDMSTNGKEAEQDDDDLARECDLLASLIEKLNYEIDDRKNYNKLLESSNKTLVDKLKSEIDNLKNKNKCLESSLKNYKEANTKLANNNQLMSKDIDKFQNELAWYNDVNYASEVEIECGKAKGFYNDNFALMLALESDEINDLINPFDYKNLNSLYNLFVPQHEKSAEHSYFSKRSQMSHTLVKNVYSKEDFNKQKTLLEKQMEESIPWGQKCKSSQIFQKIKQDVKSIFDGVECCKEVMNKNIWHGHIDPVIRSTIEQNFGPSVDDLMTNIEKFHWLLKEEMVVHLKYFNSLKNEIESLQSQLETQRTEFSNKIDQLSREYYYVDHTNAIFGVYTKLDEVTNLQCDYLDQVTKCERHERELLKRTKNVNNESFNELSKRFSELEQHLINFELALHLNVKTSNVNFVCMNCGNYVLNDNHDLCLLHYINDVNSRIKQPIAVPISNKEPKRTVNQSVATPHKKTVASESTNQTPRSIIRKLYEHVSKTYIWWYPKLTLPGYKWIPKYIMRNVKMNVSFPLGIKSRTSNNSKPKTIRKSNLSNTPLSSNSFAARTVKFGNDQIAPILGYGDLVQGNVAIKKGSRGTDLYSINLQDTNSPNPICLIAKASSSQEWLWHRRLSHLNFDSINLLSKYDIVTGLPKLKFVKDHLCSSCEMGKAKHKSFKTKTTLSSKRRLQLLHMDLCGPMRVERINADNA
ncbi:retrovirus-related pol polyprotein from transposon TNT 1-94 [Tanacetum coccineum]